MKNIQNVEVTRHGSLLTHCFSLSCEFENARYHIWMNMDTTPEEEDGKIPLYKNPPRGTEHNGPGYFRTRHLDSAAKQNAWIISEMRRIADEQELWDGAVKAAEKAEADERAASRARARINRIKENAPEMFEIVTWVANLLGTGENMSVIAKARTLVAAVEKE